MTKPRLLIPLVLLGSIFICAGVSNADRLFGIQGGSSLVTIDTNTLQASLVGAIGFQTVGGLAADALGNLYGLSDELSTPPQALLRINASSGAASVIGQIGGLVSFSTGLAYDRSSGKLYAATFGGTGIQSDFLISINPSNAAVQQIGDMSHGGIVGLECDRLNDLWGIDGVFHQLVKINKLSGSEILIGSQGLAAFPSIGSLAIGPSGKFWAINAGNQLIEIDPVSGLGTLTGTVSGLSSAVISGLTAAVAEPSTLSATVIAAISFAIGSCFFRRKSHIRQIGN